MIKRDMKLSDCLLIFGLISILLFFILIITTNGPFFIIENNDVHGDGTASITHGVPIWIVLLWIGGGALFLGICIKLFRTIKRRYEPMNFLIYLGLIITLMFLCIQLFEIYNIFTGGFLGNNNHIIVADIGLIVLILAVVSSILILILERPFHDIPMPKNTQFYPPKP
jgi:hypothetical protein